METETIFRGERDADALAIHALVAAAFQRPGRPTEPGEAALVDALRLAGGLTLSLVAESNGEIVAYVGFSPMQVTVPDSGNWQGLGMGPVAVAPAFQGRGIGSALVRAALGTCRENGYPVVFLLGSPAFYGRFGFLPAATHDLFWGDKAADVHFQVWEASPGAIPSGGAARFHPAFDAV